jgi:RNA polymerase sigma-70 factor (TIGR02943 family)
MELIAKEQLVSTWVNHYADYLFHRAITKTSNEQLAEDLVQDTFLAALEAFDNFRQESTVKTWLTAILNHKIADYFRKVNSKANNANTISKEYSQFFDNNDNWKIKERPREWQIDEEKLFDDPEFLHIYQNCLQKLRPQWSSILLAKYLEEKNSEIICQEMNISTTNYWQIIHRAKLKMRQCLQKNWFKQ